MTPLLEYAFGRPEELVIIEDWFYPCYNSAVMRIRQGVLRVVYDAAATGEEIPQISIGDQGFITACIADRKLQDQVALFPREMITSCKMARELNRTDAETARRIVDEAIIVKFHGKPKPHHVLDPFYNFFSIRLKNGSRDASFWKRELRRHWRTEQNA